MKLLLAFVSLACVAVLGSCNTAIGFSRDLRQLGAGMENKAHGRTWNGQEHPPEQQESNVPAY